MVDRLRALLEEPLDPQVGRAIVVLSGAILLGLAALFVLAARDPETNTRAEEPPGAHSTPASAAADRAPAPTEPVPSSWRRQDPQDQEGSPAARRAARALASHRALQHVPYRSAELRIELVGARGRRAVLRVTADTGRAARRGWQSFLDRHRDYGRAYIPIFRGEDGERAMPEWQEGTRG